MGVLDDAIREHLDLKRRRGTSDEEIARAEAEALGPARRAIPPSEDDERDHERVAEDLVALAEETRILDTPDDGQDDDVDVDDAPPPREPGPTHALHDIDEDPLAPPPPVERPAAEPPEAEADDEPELLEPESVEHPPEPPPPVDRTRRLDQPIRWPPESRDRQDDP